MAPTTKLCIKCNSKVKKSCFLTCYVCKGIYDLECANVSTKRYDLMRQDPENDRRDTWTCNLCYRKQSTKKNTDHNTPKTMQQICQKNNDLIKISPPKKIAQADEAGPSMCSLGHSESETGTKTTAENKLSSLRMEENECKSTTTYLNQSSSYSINSPPRTYITTRIPFKVNIATHNSFDTLSTEDDKTLEKSRIQLNRSFPELGKNDLREELEEKERKFLELENKLKISSTIQVQYLFENDKLKNRILHLEKRIATLSKICTTTPKTPISNIESSQKKKISTNLLDKQDVLENIRCDLNIHGFSSSSPKKTSMKRHRKRTNCIIKHLEAISNKMVNLQKQLNQTLKEMKYLKNAAIDTDYVQNSSQEEPDLELDSELESSQESPSELNISSVEKSTELKHKMCILSTNKQNKLLSIAESVFSHKFKFCHYLKPNCGVLHLINDIEAKLWDFTMNDFCLIMIGEEDFKNTTNYINIINNIKKKLATISHTNILLCLPTYKHGFYDMNMYNSRVETFNTKLYWDNWENEYCYIIDSNQNLIYDSTMFYKNTGHVNNIGIKCIFDSSYKNVCQILNFFR